MAEQPPDPRKALVSSGVRPSRLIAPRRRRLRMAAVGALILWPVLLAALVLLASGGASPPSPSVDEAEVQTLVAEALPGAVSPTPLDTAPPTPAPGETALSSPIASSTPTSAATPTETSAPVSAEMAVTPQQAAVPIGGQAALPIAVEVRFAEPVEGWRVRFSADIGAVAPVEVALSPDDDGAAVAEAEYTPPVDQAGTVVDVYIELLDASGDVVQMEQVVVELEVEPLEAVWLHGEQEVPVDAGALYVAGAAPLAFRLVRADGEPVRGTYTVALEAEGGTLDGERTAEIEVPPGAEVPVDFQPASGAGDTALSLTLPDGRTSTMQVVFVPPVEQITAVLDPPWEGLAVCGEGDAVRWMSLVLEAVYAEGGAAGSYPLFLSYEVVLGEDFGASLFRDAGGQPWRAETPVMLQASPAGAPPALILADGDWEPDEPIAGETLVMYADAPGLARFTLRDPASGDAVGVPLVVPVGLRRVRLAAPGETQAPVSLDNGTAYRFNPKRTGPPDEESGEAVLYTLANPGPDGVRVLAPFWVRAAYFSQDANDVATLRIAAVGAVGRTDAIPATTSIGWFRSLAETAGDVLSAENSNPDLLLPGEAGDIYVSYYGESLTLGEGAENNMYRVYAPGLAPPDALEVWPEPCPDEPPPPAPSAIPPTPMPSPTPIPSPPSA